MNTTKNGTDAMIDAMMSNHADMSPREQHLLRQSLASLVRLAKSEQMLEIRTNVRTLTGGHTTSAPRSSASGRQMQFDDFQ